MTNEEAIANLNHIYGMVSPDIQRSLDVAIKCMEDRPTGDCISREALRKEVTEKVNFTTVDGHIAYDTMLKLIDNAPTVDIKDEIAGAYNEGYMCGNKEAEKARPQGEWVEFEGGYRCSNCDDIEVYTPNFCPNCGAYMKGSKE